MAPPTKDEDEREPGQAAADRARERLQRALDRYDSETERALDAYEAEDDRPSVVTEVNVHLPKQSRRPTEAPRSLTPEQEWPRVAKAQKLLGLILKPLPQPVRTALYAALLLALAVAAWQSGLLGKFISATLGGP